MSPAKFKPREAVRILRDPPLQQFLKTWALARLLGWICLDQQRSSFRDRNAKLAGHLALACLLDRRLRPSQIQHDNTAREMLGVFMNSGGFRLFVESRLGAKSMLNRARNKATKDLGYVHRIMSYLCRYFRLVTDHGDVADGSKLTLEYAKLFVANQGREFETKKISGTNKQQEKGYKITKIGDIWETNKQAAPYVFAFNAVFADILAQAHSIDQLVDGLERLAENQELLNRLLGEAAHAADVLATTRVRGIRKQDFEDVTRVQPRLAAFNDDEMQNIKKINPHRLSEKDKLHYRPRVLRKPGEAR
jgi:hypothetical protein